VENKWHERFLELALTVASWSKDPSTRVGAVLVSDKQVLGLGYNGFPKGLRDDERLKERHLKYPRVVHAEINCLLHSDRSRALRDDLRLYVTHIPCASCAGPIINYGVTDVVTYVGSFTGGLQEHQELAIEILKEAGVKFHVI